MRLWEPLLANTPFLPSFGNHDLDTDGINATIRYNIFNFSFPSNYPFQVSGLSMFMGHCGKNEG